MRFLLVLSLGMLLAACCNKTEHPNLYVCESKYIRITLYAHGVLDAKQDAQVVHDRAGLQAEITCVRHAK